MTATSRDDLTEYLAQCRVDAAVRAAHPGYAAVLVAEPVVQQAPR